MSPFGFHLLKVKKLETQKSDEKISFVLGLSKTAQIKDNIKCYTSFVFQSMIVF